MGGVGEGGGEGRYARGAERSRKNASDARPDLTSVGNVKNGDGLGKNNKKKTDGRERC